MATKTLLTKKNQVFTSILNTKNTIEIGDFLKTALDDLVSKKQQVLFLDVDDRSVQNTTFYSKPSSSTPATAFLLIPIWKPLQHGQIQNVLDVLFSMGVYTPVEDKPQKRDLLTIREQEVLQLLAAGKSYKTIAHSLSISLATVKFHMKNLYIKLDVGNREDAIEWARQNV